jgi:hypothetical protein
MTEVEAAVTSANLFPKNSLVMLDKRCTKENPMWIKMAMVRPEDVNNVVFKIKGVIVKGVNVWYTLEKNGVHIENVPEEYLVEGHEEQINSVSKTHLGAVEEKEEEVVPEEPVESKEEVTVEEVLAPEKEEVKVEEVITPKKKK